MAKAREVLKGETIAIIVRRAGAGPVVNLRDNGFNVLIGSQRFKRDWDRAVKDGWVPGKSCSR